MKTADGNIFASLYTCVSKEYKEKHNPTKTQDENDGKFQMFIVLKFLYNLIIIV